MNKTNRNLVIVLKITNARKNYRPVVRSVRNSFSLPMNHSLHSAPYADV